MSKVAIVYWSGTGNTEAMASAVEAGAKELLESALRMRPDRILLQELREEV